MCVLYKGLDTFGHLTCPLCCQSTYYSAVLTCSPLRVQWHSRKKTTLLWSHYRLQQSTAVTSVSGQTLNSFCSSSLISMATCSFTTVMLAQFIFILKEEFRFVSIILKYLWTIRYPSSSTKIFIKRWECTHFSKM